MSQSATITVLNPTAQPPAAPEGLGARLENLDGVRIGLLDNNKPNASALLDRVGERMEAAFGAQLVRYSKVAPSLEAPRDELEEFVAQCDAVVLAIDD
ncbi:MAG: hypothetical protein V3V01_08365 [Acidimicrobiales bacterium]